MVVGLALFSWDNQKGSVLDVKYPETFELSDTELNHVYMAHSISLDFLKEEIIEVNIEDQIIISYCDKRKVETIGYEILLLVMHEKEKLNTYKLKKQLIGLAKVALAMPKDERNTYILENIEPFFKRPLGKKILLLGRACSGKTSIKKLIFEGHDPKELLYNSLEPTRGLTPSVYSWLDFNLGLFDSSGQELGFLLKNENEQKIAFQNAGYLIYVVDYPSWENNSQNIIDEIQLILDINKEKTYNSEVILFLHKIDLINEETRELELNSISTTIKEKLDLPIYFTSIYPNLNYRTYNAFYEILSSFSKESLNLKQILDNKIKGFAKLMCFITDLNNSIVVQTMSDDFNTSIVNKTHKLIAQLTISFEDISPKDIDHLTISSPENLNIIMVNPNLSMFNIKNLICISEIDDVNRLIRLMGEIKVALNTYLYVNKVD